MTAYSIRDLLTYANAQMAAEIRFPAGFLSGVVAASVLTNGNNRTSRFPSFLAQQFAARYDVLEYQTNTDTGFSGTLFRDRSTGELILSFRSTEFIDDSVRGSQATGKLEISQGGWALGQIADMEDWWRQLNGAGGPLASGQAVTVTGYSLGGHLATAFNLLRREEGQTSRITATYTYNGAGVGRLLNPSQSATPLTDLIAQFDRERRNVNGQQILFSDSGLQSTYEGIRQRIAAGGAPTLGDRALIAASLGTAEEKDIILRALDRVESVLNDIAHVASIGTTGTPPQQVPRAEIAAASLDYQVAAVRATRLTAAVNVLTAPLDRVTAADSFPNFFDVFGATVPSSVANSQVHYGAATPVFIEDQPLYRWSCPSISPDTGCEFVESVAAGTSVVTAS